MATYDCLTPRRLVMTLNGCFYCNVCNDTNLKMILVDHLFGLKACPDHCENAKRDVNAYMHREKMVLVKDAIKNNDIKNLFDYLGDNIKIIRSNGEKDEGWLICKSSFDFIPSISKYNNEWSIILEKKNEDGVITKRVVLNSLKNPELGYIHDNTFSVLLDKAFSVLDHGIYIEDYLRQPIPSNYNDLPSINTYIINNQEVRVFEP